MPVRQLQLQCAPCNAVHPHNQPTPNHVVHALVALLTAGLWIPLWILVAMSSEPAQCVKCGNRRKIDGPATAQPTGKPASVKGGLITVGVIVVVLLGLVIASQVAGW